MNSSKSWAKNVKSVLDDVDVFNETLNTIINNNEHQICIIYCPKDYWGSRETMPRLLVLCDTYLDIYLYEQKTESISKIRHSKDFLLYIERRKSLLHSWIKLCSLEDGTKLESKIEYNSVLKSLFEPIIDMFRSINYTESDLQDRAILKFYETLDYRFKFYVREFNIPISAIRTMIFQDRIIRPYLKVFKRTLAMPHLYIMTDHEWIVISEGEIKKNRATKYEDIYTFFKQNAIEKIELTAYSKDLTISKMRVTFFEKSSFSYYLNFNDGYRCTSTIESLIQTIMNFD